MSKRARIGVVGCGTITRNVHLPVLSALPTAEVAWLADVNAEAGRALSRASGVPFHLVSTRRVQVPEADLIALAIPNGARDTFYEYLRSRTEVGLFVEKPFARSVSDHHRIVGGRTASHVAIGLDRRSFAVTRTARELFEHRPFGAPVSVSIEFGGLGGLQTGGGYMSDPAIAGGGTLFQVGVHFLDAVLFASRATDVISASGHQIQAAGLDIHVEGQLTLRLSDGTRLPLNVLVTQLRATSNRIQLVFELATISFSVMYGSKHLEVSPRHGKGPTWRLAPDEKSGPLEMFASFGLHWTNVIQAFQTGKENYTSASQAVLTTKALELLYALPSEN